MSETEKESRRLLRMLKHIEEARAYAANRNGRLLSSNINGKKDFVDWECAAGHSWSQPLSNVISNNSWCLICSGNAPRNLQVLIDIAISRGGKVLSTEYVNVDTTYDFECSLGHKFSNTFKHVEKRGQWCPTCNKGSKSEEIARTTFEQLFGYRFPKVRPKWLKNARGYQMEIDGFCEELSIGFEYQGIQHFSKQIYGGNLDQRIEDDIRKAVLCKENSVFLFILTHEMKYEDFPIEIANQASHLGIEMPENWRDIQVNIFEAYIREDRIEELRQILSERLIEVLSPKYLGSNEYIELRCLKCRNIWKAKGSAFFNSRKTAGCDKCARRRSGLLQKLSLEDLRDYAAANDGELISTHYEKKNHWYIWRCKLGHDFEGNFNNMEFRKQFCPVCENRQIRKRKK